MSKFYHIESKLGAKSWQLVKVETRQVDALHYVREHATELSKYPLRIIRVVRTLVFESGK